MMFSIADGMRERDAVNVVAADKKSACVSSSLCLRTARIAASLHSAANSAPE